MEWRESMDGFTRRVIGGALEVWGRNIVGFSALALLINLPAVGVCYGLARLGPEQMSMLWPIAIGLGFVLGSLLSAAITWSVLQDLRQQRPPITDSLSKGLRRARPVLVVTFVSSFMICASTKMLIVPGLMVMMMLYVAVPVVVMEDIDPVEALYRSCELTDGARRALFAAVVAIGTVGVGLAWAAGALVTNPTDALVVGQIVGAIFMPPASAAAAVAYFLLREEREGVRLDELASIAG